MYFKMVVQFFLIAPIIYHKIVDPHFFWNKLIYNNSYESSSYIFLTFTKYQVDLMRQKSFF